ncbi:MAG: hypothetical protein QXU32_06600 [Nitrososphaerales archaeon]
MPYSTIAQIKEWLPGITGSGFDSELAGIQSDINREIDRKLALVTELPVTDSAIRGELAKFEARLSALRFQIRRAGGQERPQILEMIDKEWKEFDEFTVNRYGYGVVIG